MTAFIKKEFTEALRTHKMTVLGLVFLLFGIMSPAAAKFLPQILASALPEGMNITLPEPAALDSWAQFFKNVSQMGLIVVVILFGGLMTGELSRGTIVPLLAKGLSRRAAIFAKFLSASALWTAAYLLCAAVTLAYTLYFWPDGATPHLPAALAALWGFGELLIASLLLGGVLFKSNYGCLLFAGAFVVLLFLLNLSPAVKEISPLVLTSGAALMTGAVAASDLTAPALSALALIAAFLIGAVAVFDRRTL